MNEIIQSLYARKSVRAYTDRPVPAEVKRTVLAAAVQAPTAGGQQLYTILDITDQRLKDTLAETCDHQPFISTAPVVLIFCADCLRWWDAYAEAGCDPRRPGPGDLMHRTPWWPPTAWGLAPAISETLWSGTKSTGGCSDCRSGCFRPVCW